MTLLEVRDLVKHYGAGGMFRAAARPVRQDGGIMGRQVASDPSANTEPCGAHMLGHVADRLSFSHQQHRLDPAIQPRFAGRRQRTL